MAREEKDKAGFAKAKREAVQVIASMSSEPHKYSILSGKASASTVLSDSAN